MRITRRRPSEDEKGGGGGFWWVGAWRVHPGADADLQCSHGAREEAVGCLLLGGRAPGAALQCRPCC